MAKKKHHRQLSREEIIAQCSKVAMHRRTVEQSAWTAIGIVTSYSLMMTDHLEGEELAEITHLANDLQQKMWYGEVDSTSYADRIYEYAGWTVEYESFSESDITAKKGSFDYFLQSKQVDPGNTVNEYTSQFLLAFFTVLIDRGFDPERLTAVEQKISEVFKLYASGLLTVKYMEKALEDETGVVYQHPVDPLSKKSEEVSENE